MPNTLYTYPMHGYFELILDGRGADALADVTVDVYQVLKTDPTQKTLHKSGLSASNTGGGFFSVGVEDCDLVLYDYIGKFMTESELVLSKHVPYLRATDVRMKLSMAVTSQDVVDNANNLLKVKRSYTMRETIKTNSTLDLNAADLIFGIKEDLDDADENAIVLIDKLGLQSFNKVKLTGQELKGSYSVSGVVGAWEIEIYVDEIITDTLNVFSTEFYEVKAIISGDALLAASGKAKLTKGTVKQLS